MAGITLPPQNAAQFAMRTLAQRLATAAKPDEATARRLREAREQAEQAVKTLENPKADIKAERKKAAKQRLEVLNQALRMLKMVGGDAKIMAREGARLARELGKVVKEYIDAGGGGATPVPVPVPAGDAKAADAKGPVKGDAKTDAGGEADGAVKDAAVKTDAAAVADAEAGAEADTDADAADADDRADDKADDKAGSEAGSEADTDADAAEDEAKEKPGADGFAQQARVLAKKLKIFLNQQKERLLSEQGVDAQRALKDAKDALQELRQTEAVVRGLPGGNEGESPAEGMDMLV